jgi:hypothetical protein
VPVYAVPPSRPLRKSSSLPRLSKRSGAQGTSRSNRGGTEGERKRERRESVPDLPQVSREARERAHLLSEQLARNGSGVEVGSEDETASVDKSSGRGDFAEQKEAVVSTEELRLEEEDVRQQPVVIVEHPTPDVVEEVRAVRQQGSLE